MGTAAEREAVRAAVRSLLEADRAGGALKESAAYKQLFPGFWDLVGEEYDRLRPAVASQPGTPPSADTDPGSRRTTPGPGAVPAAEKPADRIGPYRIVREIGHGGMGVVYEAQDTRLPRRVALKVLNPQFSSSTQLRLRFQREAELASKLDHPHICTVYEAGEDDGAPYMAMRFVEGRPLSELLVATREAQRTSGVVHIPSKDDEAAGDGAKRKTGETRPELERVLLLFEKAARAVHAAHEKGLIHRDIKPHNLMVTPEGEPILLDFGLAREEAGEGHQLTQTGSLMGTPAYMSPEQLMAQRVRLDRRTDVYSLGVSLYECLTLRLPFEAPTVDRLYQKILATDPEDPRKINRALPEDMKVVLATAMEKDRERRYGTALDLAEEIRRIREHEPIRARPPGVGYRALRFIQRNASVVLGASVASFCVGAVLWTLLSARIGQTPETLAAIADEMRTAGEPSAASRYYEKALEKGGWNLFAIETRWGERVAPTLEAISRGYGPVLMKSAMEARTNGGLQAAQVALVKAATCFKLHGSNKEHDLAQDAVAACRSLRIVQQDQPAWRLVQDMAGLYLDRTWRSNPSSYSTVVFPALADPAHPEAARTGAVLALRQYPLLAEIAAIPTVSPASLLQVIPGSIRLDEDRFARLSRHLEEAVSVLATRASTDTVDALRKVLEDPNLPERSRRMAVRTLATAIDVCPTGELEPATEAAVLALAAAMHASDPRESWRTRVALAVDGARGGSKGADAWLRARTGCASVPTEGWSAWWEERKSREPAEILREEMGLTPIAGPPDLAKVLDEFLTATGETAAAWHTLLALSVPEGVRAPVWPATNSDGSLRPVPEGIGRSWYSVLKERIPARHLRLEVAAIVPGPGNAGPTVAWSDSLLLEAGEEREVEGDRHGTGLREAPPLVSWEGKSYWGYYGYRRRWDLGGEFQWRGTPTEVALKRRIRVDPGPGGARLAVFDPANPTRSEPLTPRWSAERPGGGVWAARVVPGEQRATADRIESWMDGGALHVKPAPTEATASAWSDLSRRAPAVLGFLAFLAAVLANLWALAFPEKAPEGRLRPAWMLILLGVATVRRQLDVAGLELPTDTAGFLMVILGFQVLGSAARGWAAHLPAACAMVSGTMMFLADVWRGGAVSRQILEACSQVTALIVLATLPALTRGLRPTEGPAASLAAPRSRLERALASDRFLAVSWVLSAASILLLASFWDYFGHRLHLDWETRDRLMLISFMPPLLWLVWAAAVLRSAINRIAGGPSIPVRLWRRLRGKSAAATK
jgi:serine/threonine protein kinase